jgi:hypothetical protein
VPTGIAVEQQVEIVHRAHLARLLAWRALVLAAKTAGRWITILIDVANVTTVGLTWMRVLKSILKS